MCMPNANVAIAADPHNGAVLADQLGLFAALYHVTHGRKAGPNTMIVAHLYLAQRVAQMPPLGLPSPWHDHLAVEAFNRGVLRPSSKAALALQEIHPDRLYNALRFAAGMAELN